MTLCCKLASKAVYPHASSKHELTAHAKQHLQNRKLCSRTRRAIQHQKMAAWKILCSWPDRVKETWKRQRNVELCDMAAKDASQFWRDLQTLRSNACPLKLTAQFGGFTTSMGADS